MLGKLETWRNDKVSVITLCQLEIICDELSSTCHKYRTVNVSPNRVRVEYSNPDEYGNSHPMVAVFPAYRNGWNITNVVLEIIDVLHDNWNGEGHQAFQGILDFDISKTNPNK